MSIEAIRKHYMHKAAEDDCKDIAQIYTFLGVVIKAGEANDETSLNKCHLEIKKIIEKNPTIFNGPIIDEYLVKFEEYHYTICFSCGNEKHKEWQKNGQRHRITKRDGMTLPAVIRDNGKTMIWYVDGNKHRDDRGADGLMMPAEIRSNNDQVWYKNGKVHREDRDADGLVLPAYVMSSGVQIWYKDDERHRDDLDADGFILPAYITDSQKTWYKNGKKHRTEKKDGLTLPAEINWDDKAWYVNGKLERDDVDEYGNLLPTEITGTASYWNRNNRQHRAELGKNPHDKENYGKALPAIIFKNGQKNWIFQGMNMSQAKLTNKITKRNIIDCTDSTGLEIVSADGNIIKLTGQFTVHVLR